MGLDSVEIIVGVEHAFNIRIPDEVAASILTPRDLIMYVSSVVELQPTEHCETQRIFYAIRRFFPEARTWFRPSTKLSELLQLKPWAIIRAQLWINCSEHLLHSIFGLEVKSVGELVFWIAEKNQMPQESWTRESVALMVRKVIYGVLGQRGFSQNANFVRDLGVN